MSIFVPRGQSGSVVLEFCEELDLAYLYRNNTDTYVPTLTPSILSAGTLVSRYPFGSAECDGNGDYTIGSKGAIEGVHYYSTTDGRQYVYSLIDRPAHTITFGGTYNNSDSSGPNQSTASIQWATVDIPAIQGDIIDCTATWAKNNDESVTVSYDFQTRSGADVPNAEVVIYVDSKYSKPGGYFTGLKRTVNGLHKTVKLTKSEHGYNMDIHNIDVLTKLSISVRISEYGNTVAEYKTFDINTAPTITPSSSSLGNIYSTPSLSYTVKDSDNDSVTVTESLNGLTKSTTVTRKNM